MRARQTALRSDLFGENLAATFPIISPGSSDSAMFDNCLEFLYLAGRSLPHALMMMIPEPWSHHEEMDDDRKAFYEYHACLMEPWDGPAAIAFTDGRQVGAVLDRNGLRPSRYYVTKDERVILASGVGVLDIPPALVAYKGRLQPGRMLLVDTEQGRIVSDEELKNAVVKAHPYRRWLQDNQIQLAELPKSAGKCLPSGVQLRQYQKAFGYTFEDLRFMLGPMAKDGVEPVGAMGMDSPLAVLSQRPQLLYEYFKQLFAQVTNPPVDALREKLVTASEVYLGSQGNLLDPDPAAGRLEEKAIAVRAERIPAAGRPCRTGNPGVVPLSRWHQVASG
jgi:hypothetical protein